MAHSANIKRLEGRIAKLESTPAFKNPRPNPKEAEGEMTKGSKN
jgi:hypothetical protein